MSRCMIRLIREKRERDRLSRELSTKALQSYIDVMMGDFMRAFPPKDKTKKEKNV